MPEWEEKDLKAGYPDTKGELLLLQLGEYKYQNSNTEIQICKNKNTQIEATNLKAGYPDTKGELQLREYKYQKSNTKLQIFLIQIPK